MHDTAFDILGFDTPAVVRPSADDLAAPGWVDALLDNAPPPHECDGVTRTDGDRFTLLTARVANATDLTPRDTERETARAYAALARAVRESDRPRHPVRFWNHVPFITDPADAGRDNYMVF